MKPREIKGEFGKTAYLQEKYFSLVAICDKLGVMVSQDRFLEHDKDIAPYQFYRKGTKEYIFPKQPVTLLKDTSQDVDHSPGYGLRTEVQTFNFDEAVVKGRIQIFYEDANNQPTLKVVDVLGNSVLPKRVMNTLDDIFARAHHTSKK